MLVYIGIIFASLDALNPQNSYLLLAMTVFIYWCFNSNRSIIIRKVGSLFQLICLLIVGSCTAFFFGKLDTVYTANECYLVYFILPIIIWFIGCLLVNTVSMRSFNPSNVVFLLTVGAGVHALLNMNINRGVGRFNLIDFFSGTELSATNQGSINTLIFSIIAAIMICAEKWYIKATGIIIFLISVIFGMNIGSRSGFVTLAVVTIVVTLLYMKNENASIRNNTLLKILLIIPVIILVIIIMYNFNIFGIKDKILSSNLLSYIVDSESSRSDTYRSYLITQGIRNFWTTAIGGQRTNIAFYHNMWLDIARVAGWIPSLFMLFFNVSIFIRACKILKMKNIPLIEKYVLFGAYLGAMINMTVEPILDGYISFYYRFLFIAGLIEGTYQLRKKWEG